MNIKQLSLATAVSALTFTTATNAVLGPIPIYLNPVKVSSNYFNDLDTHATFASEITKIHLLPLHQALVTDLPRKLMFVDTG